MLKWLIALFLAVLVLGMLQPRLTRALRLGRLPGDIRFTRGGREYVFPFASALLLSLLLSLLARLF